MVEAAPYVLQVRQTVTRQDGGLRLERDELDVQPRSTIIVAHLGLETSSQRGGVVAEADRRPQLLHVDLGLETCRTEVAIDDARDVLVQTKTQEEVVASDRIRGRDGSCPANRWDPAVAASVAAVRHRCILSGRGARGLSWSR